MDNNEKPQKGGGKGRRVGAVLMAIALVAVGFLAGWFGRYGAIDPRMRRLMWAVKTTEKNFYTDWDVYENLFAALTPDAYSCYYTAEQYDEIMRESEGENVGAGFSISPFETDGSVRVFSVVGNSPAEHAGLRKGMYIYECGTSKDKLEEVTSSDSIYTAVHASKTIYLKCGYTPEITGVVEITVGEYAASYCIYRDAKGTYAFRGDKADQLVLADVTKEYGVLEGADEKTAYIRIDEFNGYVAREFKACLALMKARGKQNLVLDLRSNGGGYLDKLLSVASHLMKDASGELITVATAKYKGGNEQHYATATNDYYDYFSADSRILFLADEYTASASECLLGAMLDYGTISYEDVIVREETGRSYGKGIMQSHFSDLQGNVMKLTVATIHWPVSGRCIQGVGVGVADGAKSVDAPFVWSLVEDKTLSFALTELAA